MDQIKILMVDDEEELIAAWIERIELRGINARGVTNGKDALKIIKDNDFDVLVLDLKMPGISGYDMMQLIKKEKPDLPIIIITGHQCNEEETNSLPANAFDCLIKPVNIEILIEKIKKAANYRKQQK